jgi:hypothetical protein
LSHAVQTVIELGSSKLVEDPFGEVAPRIDERRGAGAETLEDSSLALARSKS